MLPSRRLYMLFHCGHYLHVECQLWTLREGFHIQRVRDGQKCERL
jgi:hypothetical protein